MIFLGLGCNLGDREANMRRALELLAQQVRVLRVSSIIETPALLPENAPSEWDIPYLNLVCACKTTFLPLELLAYVKSIEQQMGRKDVGRWGPRIMDIDILAYDDVVMESKTLTLPHPQMLKRDFVMRPLQEIAPHWQHPAHHPKIMAIVNLTPDSFSDGGGLSDVNAALRHIGQLLDQGASVIDIGAESTRPDAQPVAPEEEWARLSPVLLATRRQFPDALFSVDTRHAETAARALDMGVDWINDVSGGRDVAMQTLLRTSSCRFVLMHALSVPVDPDEVVSGDVVRAITQWVETLRERFDLSRAILDVGLGFGKNAAQSWELLQRVEEWLYLHPFWLVGHSRKSFLGKERCPTDRDLETHIVSALLADKAVSYVRVHDVAGTKRALTVAQTLLASASKND